MDTASHHRNSDSGSVMEEGRSESLPPPRSVSPSGESQLGSDLKRQKVEESDDALKNRTDVEIDEAEEEDRDDDDDDDSDDSSDYSDFPWWYPQDEEGKRQLKVYLQSIVDSEGYDVAECPLKTAGPDHGYLKVHLDGGPPHHYHVVGVHTSLEHVIREQNEKGNQLTLVKLENATSMLVNGFNYYITFSAETGPTKEIKVYQAEVYCNFYGEVIRTTVFREKPPPKS